MGEYEKIIKLSPPSMRSCSIDEHIVQGWRNYSISQTGLAKLDWVYHITIRPMIGQEEETAKRRMSSMQRVRHLVKQYGLKGCYNLYAYV